MNVPMQLRLPILPLLAVVLALSACMSGGPTRAEKLASYQAYAGTPLRQIRYNNPIGWEEIDGQHIVLTVRPHESYLVRLSGPCLDYDDGSPVLVVSSTAGYVASGFDRVTVGSSGFHCRIEEIRPIDMQALRANEANTQPGG